MAKVRVELNRDGVSALMKSPEMMAVCQGYANRALSSLGAGYESNSHVGKTRLNVEVEAKTFAARKENSENNSILKALGGSKG